MTANFSCMYLHVCVIASKDFLRDLKYAQIDRKTDIRNSRKHFKFFRRGGWKHFFCKFFLKRKRKQKRTSEIDYEAFKEKFGYRVPVKMRECQRMLRNA